MRGWLVRGGNAGNHGVQCEKKSEICPWLERPGFSNMARAHGDPFPFLFFFWAVREEFSFSSPDFHSRHPLSLPSLARKKIMRGGMDRAFFFFEPWPALLERPGPFEKKNREGAGGLGLCTAQHQLRALRPSW